MAHRDHVIFFLIDRWLSTCFRLDRQGWINEQYAYTIFGMLSTKTSPVVARKISKMADIEASFMTFYGGAEKIGLHQDS